MGEWTSWINTNSFKIGFIATAVLEVIRGMVNGALKETTPAQLRWSIENDKSLWGMGASQIKGIKSAIPFIPKSAMKMKAVVDAEYGGFNRLMLMWIQEDHPIYYNIITNYPDGKGTVWLEKQVEEIFREIDK